MITSRRLSRIYFVAGVTVLALVVARRPSEEHPYVISHSQSPSSNNLYTVCLCITNPATFEVMVDLFDDPPETLVRPEHARDFGPFTILTVQARSSKNCCFTLPAGRDVLARAEFTRMQGFFRLLPYTSGRWLYALNIRAPWDTSYGRGRKLNEPVIRIVLPPLPSEEESHPLPFPSEE